MKCTNKIIRPDGMGSETEDNPGPNSLWEHYPEKHWAIEVFDVICLFFNCGPYRKP